MSDIPLSSKDESQKEWRCYHCDEVFTSQVDAWHHFGGRQTSEPACQIKAPGEFALLEALRNAEDQLARYHSEDSDVIRAMHSMTADHAVALRREEEKGYARGLEDAKKHPESIGLRSAVETTVAPDVALDKSGPYCDEHLTDVRAWCAECIACTNERRGVPAEHGRRIVGHASGWQEQMDTCVCGAPWPCSRAETGAES